MTTPERSTESVETPEEQVEALVDEWGEDSFPASDPPGTLPPSLEKEEADAD